VGVIDLRFNILLFGKSKMKGIDEKKREIDTK
jgi:hypothetical protein